MNKRLRDLLVTHSDNLFIQLLRYTFVGGFAFVVDYGLLYVLTEWAGFHYLLSATFAFIVGLIVNYLISTWWVFGASPYKKRVEILLFALIGVVGLGLNDLFMWIFTDQFNLHYMLSKPITAVLVYLWNFLGRRFLIFNKNR